MGKQAFGDSLLPLRAEAARRRAGVSDRKPYYYLLQTPNVPETVSSKRMHRRDMFRGAVAAAVGAGGYLAGSCARPEMRRADWKPYALEYPLAPPRIECSDI